MGTSQSKQLGTKINKTFPEILDELFNEKNLVDMLYTFWYDLALTEKSPQIPCKAKYFAISEDTKRMCICLN